jgi:4-hydroxy-tetrahydrodipicolinate reductase
MTDPVNPIKLAIHGAAGRMGQRLVALSKNDPELQLVLALEHPQSPHQGRDAGEIAGVGQLGVAIEHDIVNPPDVIIDFSVPEACLKITEICSKRQIPLVIATTGMTPEQKEIIYSAAQLTPIVFSPSMSVAVNIAMKLVQQAARALSNNPSGVDVEIVERHHRFKEDSPSGTALKFGEIVADEMDQTIHRHGREGRIGARPRNEIGYHAIRTGDNVGEHSIIFGLMGETLEVYVRGNTRDSYAYGALEAAKFIITKKPGLYSMADVLNLNND